MPNTYKSLGKAKRQQFLDSRARAGVKIKHNLKSSLKATYLPY
ncbi:hypothetical protein [Bernardetia litoralis]|nr:hypothetical protein [Bernardetia litoralis]